MLEHIEELLQDGTIFDVDLGTCRELTMEERQLLSIHAHENARSESWKKTSMRLNIGWS